MSGTTTPTSAASYSEAELLAKLGVAADASDCFKGKEINALLFTKGVKGRGKKAQKAKQVALVCTSEEVLAFRAEKEAEALAGARAKALTMEESVKRMRTR